jgi:hypothetical protein
MSKMGRVAISIVLYLIHGFKAAHSQRLVSARAAVRLARLFSNFDAGQQQEKSQKAGKSRSRHGKRSVSDDVDGRQIRARSRRPAYFFGSRGNSGLFPFV